MTDEQRKSVGIPTMYICVFPKVHEVRKLHIEIMKIKVGLSIVLLNYVMSQCILGISRYPETYKRCRFASERRPINKGCGQLLPLINQI